MSQELFDAAIQLEDEGDLTGALDVWRRLAATEPTANVFLRLGRAAKEAA